MSLKNKIIKIFLKNCQDINEERKNDIKYQDQANYLFIY